MASLEESLVAFLLSKTPVTDLVADRINPDILPQGSAVPAISYRRISTSHGDNILGSKSGMASMRLQIDVYAATRKQANETSEAIRLSGILDVYGDMYSTNVRSVQVDNGQRHYTEPPEDGSDEFRYVTSQDYAFYYLEEV